MGAEHPGHFFRGVQFGVHGTFPPCFQKPGGNGGILKVLPQEVGLGRLDVEERSPFFDGNDEQAGQE